MTLLLLLLLWTSIATKCLVNSQWSCPIAKYCQVLLPSVWSMVMLYCHLSPSHGPLTNTQKCPQRPFSTHSGPRRYSKALTLSAPSYLSLSSNWRAYSAPPYIYIYKSCSYLLWTSRGIWCSQVSLLQGRPPRSNLQDPLQLLLPEQEYI